jgi:hypothetical protein
MGYDRTEYGPIVAHEWFHFVQAHYASAGITSAWLADASATWYEWMVGNKMP